MTPRLLTFGETMGLAVADDVGAFPAVGSLRYGIGGAESNVAMGVARLGVPATWVGRVGCDATGALIAHRLRAAGVEAVCIDDPSYTGIMVRHRPAGSLVRVDYHRAGSAGSHLQAADIGDERIRAAGVLHVTGITPALSASASDAVQHAVDVATEARVPVSVDVNYRAKLWDTATAAPQLRALVRRADIVFAGVAEAALVLGVDDRDAATLAVGLADLGPAEAIVKDGARGCAAVIDGVGVREAAVPVPVVDPVGAGDAFVAGYLAERLAGACAAARLRTATAMGAYAVSVPGDCDSLPDRFDLDALRAAVADPEVTR